MRFEQTLLFDALKIILSDGTAIKEYELLQLLQKPPWELFAANALTTELQLFQTHFALFHTLYQLQEHWLVEGQGYLKISALHIQLLDDTAKGIEDEAEAKIKAYYNDWRHFSDTTEQDVEALLDSFWRSFGNVEHWQLPGQSEIQAALTFFALPQQASWPAIRRSYLKFQLQNHPDRGGDVQLSKSAASHFDVLKRYCKQAA